MESGGEITLQQALIRAAEKHRNGRLNEAESIYKKVLEKNPKNSNALHLLGLVEHQRGNPQEAINLIKKAIELHPDSTYYGNLGMVYGSIEEQEKSAEAFRTALDINPTYKNAYLAHYNLGIFSEEKGDFKEALEHYEKSIKLKQEFTEAHWNRSLVLLLLGKFEEGWKEYKYRLKKENPLDMRIFNKPELNGEFLGNKKLLIVSEQGFGDNIQFIRYVPLVKEKGGHIILECKKELEKLFMNIQGIDEIIIKEKNKVPDVDFDYYIHLMDIPGVINVSMENMTNNVPYLKANQKLSEEFRKEFKTGKFNVGIVWAGNSNQENDKNRSSTFESFRALEDIPGVALFSLQKGKAETQLKDSGIIDLSGKINDFSDTAAVIDNLDLIISVDTSVAHLAGAMGKPIWTLLTLYPDWRWFLERSDSPFYPTMKLFRQKKKGDWNSILLEVRKELEKLSQKVIS